MVCVLPMWEALIVCTAFRGQICSGYNILYAKEHLKVVDPDLQQGLLFPLLGGVAVVKTRTFTPWTPGPSPPL